MSSKKKRVGTKTEKALSEVGEVREQKKTKEGLKPRGQGSGLGEKMFPPGKRKNKWDFPESRIHQKT